jgi:hypothetical protein
MFLVTRESLEPDAARAVKRSRWAGDETRMVTIDQNAFLPFGRSRNFDHIVYMERLSEKS